MNSQFDEHQPLTALRENWADARMNTKEVAVVLDRRIVIADI